MKEETEAATALTPDYSSYPEEVRYAIDYEKRQTLLEARLHSEEDPEVIAMTALMDGADFYDGDWCGIIQGDLDMGAWCPVLWYDRKTGGMTETRFHDFEDTHQMDRWIEALYACKPVIIPDTSIYKETNPIEYEIYNRCLADSILAVPFWKNPIGFMIVRNPKRYSNYSTYLQASAWVVFSSVTQKKLIQNSRKSFPPRRIQNDKDVIVNLFGKLELYTSQGALSETDLSAPMLNRLLVYLILHRGHTIPAWKIYADIWPEREVDNPNNNIKGLAFRLQSLFSIISEYRLFICTNQAYQINPELNVITDADMFTDYRIKAHSAVTLQTKIELLKSAVNLYCGDLFPVASAEHWLLPYEFSYRYDCQECYHELVGAYFECKDYENVRYYAALALKSDPQDVDAYYWTIRALRQQSSHSLAKGELEKARYFLTGEEYQKLFEKLDHIKE